MRVADFHFELPEELIAQHPPEVRGASRMLVLESQGTGSGRPGGAGLVDGWFRELPEFLRAGDLVVLNDSRVLPARLFASRGGLTTQAGSPAPSGVVEVLLTEEVERQGTGIGEQGTEKSSPGRGDERHLVWRALVRPARKVGVGERLEFREGSGELVLRAEVVGAGEFGERTLRFDPVEDFFARVGRIGHMPLPPYIRRGGMGREANHGQHREKERTQGRRPAAAEVEAEDRERYQTVYGRDVGSAAAPTAGLHFTPEMLAALEARGVEVRYVTLHVGLGTFQPVRVDRLEEIRLHAERYTLPEATAEALNRAVREGRRVVAVGTTTTRTLEHIGREAERADHREHGETESAQRGCAPGGRRLRFEAHSGATSIFIGPGHRFRVVGGLLTNFHLPESTLLMLVSAFAGDGDEGRQRVLAAYAHAVRERYRFYSYGDCMLVLPDGRPARAVTP